MKKLLGILAFFGLSSFWTANAQVASTTINGIPPPYVFNGAGVSQSGQTFTFGGGGGGGDTITSPNSTLSIGGTSTNTTIDFNLSNANIWLATQTFPNASITNAELANPAITVNGQTCTLGSTCTVTSVAPLGTLALNSFTEDSSLTP